MLGIDLNLTTRLFSIQVNLADFIAYHKCRTGLDRFYGPRSEANVLYLMNFRECEPSEF